MTKVKKRRRATSRKRKTPRTAAQIAATRKLVALNKRRAKKRPPKKLTLAEKRKRAASRKRRKIFEKKHNWAIKAHVGKTCRWWTGKGFTLAKDLGKNPKKLYTSRIKAEKAARAMLGRLPAVITSLEITNL